jgi:hypothetical protein
MNIHDLMTLVHKVGVPICALSAEKISEIKNAPRGQNRTANWKKAVYIVEDLVFKGPYTSDKDFSRLMKNLRYAYAIELLEAAMQLPEWQRGSLPWEYLGCGDENQYYLAAPNVGKWINIPSKLESTEVEKNVLVVPRTKAIMRVSDIEENGQLTNDVKLASLQHLYLRFLLDIGDSGTNNVLIREDCHSSGRLIAGIDLEDRRGNGKKKRRLHLLFSKPYEKHIPLYRSDISKIKLLSYSQLDQLTSDRLSAVGIDLERLKENMDLWVKTPI